MCVCVVLFVCSYSVIGKGKRGKVRVQVLVFCRATSIYAQIIIIIIIIIGKTSLRKGCFFRFVLFVCSSCCYDDFL